MQKLYVSLLLLFNVCLLGAQQNDGRPGLVEAETHNLPSGEFAPEALGTNAALEGAYYAGSLDGSARPALQARMTTVCVSPNGVSAGQIEKTELINTLTDLGFNVVISSDPGASGCAVFVGHPGGDIFNEVPSSSWVSSGGGYVQISDWGPNYISNSFISIPEDSDITILNNDPSGPISDPLTVNLPSSWGSKGFWRYGFDLVDYVGFSTDESLPNIVSTEGQDRVYTGTLQDDGRLVYMGWNVYGCDATMEDLQALQNAVLWSAGLDPAAASSVAFEGDCVIGGPSLGEYNCDSDFEYDSDSDTYTLEATNCYYANPFNEDNITFVYEELCGDGEIITHVDNIDTYAWAGLMMREDGNPGSKKISLARDNGYLARREVRTTTNGAAYPQQFPAFGKNWLRITREGNFFRAFVSPNGVNWQQVAVTYMFLDDCIQVGMFLTNKQFSTQTVYADFHGFEINGGDEPLQQLPGLASDAPIGNIAVYPNPSDGPVTVDLGTLLDKEVRLDLRNANGQILRQLDVDQLSDRYTDLQLSDLPAGIYWLRVQAAGEAPITERIVVQRP